MKSHYGKLMDDKAVASIVSLRALAESDEIDIPDVQRGLVWNPTQIANLWKSIFAGYPIGALTLYEQDGQWQLIDGQQRWHAIKLGLMEPDEGAMTTLWVKNPDNLELMVCTRRHPWGFVWKENKLEKLSHEDMMKLWKKMMQTDDITFSIPDMKKASYYWEKEGWVPLYRILAKEKHFSVPEPVWQKTEEWRKRVSADSLPLIRFSLAVQDADTDKNRIHEQNANSLTLETKDADTGKNRIHELFTRINKGGTQISPVDYTYSTLCSYLGKDFKEAINKIAKDFMPPNRVARIYARLAYAAVKSETLKEPDTPAFWRTHKYEEDISKDISKAIGKAKELLKDEDVKIPASIYLSATSDEWLTVICWCMWRYADAVLDGSLSDKKLLCMLPYVVCRDPGYHTRFCERFYEALNAEELKDTNLLELIAIGVAYAACYSAKTGMYPLNKPEKVELKAEYPHNEEWLHIFANPRNEALLHFLQAPYMNLMLKEECGFYPHEPATWGEAMNRPWDVDHIVPQSRWWLLEPDEWLYRESLANKQMLYYRRNREKNDSFAGVPADATNCPKGDFCYPCSVLFVDKNNHKYYCWENVRLFNKRPAKLHASHRKDAQKKNYPEFLDGYKALINSRLAEMVNRLWEMLDIESLIHAINQLPKRKGPDCLRCAVQRWSLLESQYQNLRWCAIRHDESRQQEIAVKDFYHSLCSCLAVGVEENDAFRCFCWQQVDARTLKIEVGSRRLPDMTQAEWLKGAEKEGSRSAWWVEDGSFKDGTYVYGEKDTKPAALEAILKKVHPHG